ncbi:hypothetical protein SF1_02090 [Sphingobacterium faecium NBRC 15299]|uniref:hypothetical protein n=2 Tax=Sphingobacterium faecium TaxID=34087 RepID=UPI000D3324A9|nr:hypothetical protein [Sphingobacterium faecium]PTX12518.1 hypothetical protein C8N37_102212 [Sphingobacterium faecium]GEM62227.1 hypothetical protein SF1_02090 [Sphingobacterium faecium NBRC 15299]
MSMPNITILNAGPGMGFYIPGIIMHRQLKSAGIDSCVHVFERFYQQQKKDIIPQIKSTFQENFSIALLAHKLARNPQDALDDQAVGELLALWVKEQRRHFVVFSGFWLPILQRYRELIHPIELQIDCCHLDADYSVSWKMHMDIHAGMNNKWFHHWEEQAINYHIDVDNGMPLPFEERTNNLLIHGGGWGLGDFEKQAARLFDTQYNLSMVAYGNRDFKKEDARIHFYHLSSEWNIWDTDENGEHGFPPLYDVDRDHDYTQHRLNDAPYSPLYQIAKSSKAIICKPGAGTLIDSLSAATPLIILEPYGKSEDKNGLLWKHHGLGMSFDDWAAGGFSHEALERMHVNLLAMRAKSQNYIQLYIKNLHHNRD